LVEYHTNSSVEQEERNRMDRKEKARIGRRIARLYRVGFPTAYSGDGKP
jgi:hypothetical protein